MSPLRLSELYGCESPAWGEQAIKHRLAELETVSRVRSERGRGKQFRRPCEEDTDRKRKAERIRVRGRGTERQRQTGTEKENQLEREGMHVVGKREIRDKEYSVYKNLCEVFVLAGIETVKIYQPNKAL